ncbi:hypothetical protein JOB18_028854 [Solea senegalensis]|uniref:Uncharacterized protein n=1 Tax=Solea senegalensis TaxID=28829 RepID=A0AAV6PKC0_SOLSE|nr:hypothetical protein JOB18_028854 [Solea senegalensis]
MKPQERIQTTRLRDLDIMMHFRSLFGSSSCKQQCNSKCTGSRSCPAPSPGTRFLLSSVLSSHYRCCW